MVTKPAAQLLGEHVNLELESIAFICHDATLRAGGK